MDNQTEGIVIKSFDYQDHHKIVKLISPTLGLISIFVSYANKKTSKNRALCVPMTHIRLHFKQPTEQSGLYYLIHGDIIDAYYELKLDYENILRFYDIAEIFLKGDIDAPYFSFYYRLFNNCLNSAYIDCNFKLATVIFKIKALYALGITTFLDACIKCGIKHDILTLSIQASGLLCKHCFNEDNIPLPAHLIPYVRRFNTEAVEALQDIDMNDSDIHVLETFLDVYYASYSAIKFAKRY